MNAQVQQELEATITGVGPTDNTTIQALRKIGDRPVTTFAPVVEDERPVKPAREATLFERTDIQRAEVQLQMHRRTEELLVEQVKLAEAELAGVRRVIAGVEALLASHEGAA